MRGWCCWRVCAGALLAACKKDNNTTDTKGLWVANGTTVLEYVPSQLTAGVVNAAPHLMITGGAVGTPQGVTFDSSGNLWVMDPRATVNGVANTPALLKFSAAQLAALATTDSPEPVAIITSTSFAFPQQSVFDSKGNQWVTRSQQQYGPGVHRLPVGRDGHERHGSRGGHQLGRLQRAVGDRLRQLR